jgi:hypothetical protein
MWELVAIVVNRSCSGGAGPYALIVADYLLTSIWTRTAPADGRAQPDPDNAARMSRSEILGGPTGLLFAGHETTVAAVDHGVGCGPSVTAFVNGGPLHAVSLGFRHIIWCAIFFSVRRGYAERGRRVLSSCRHMCCSAEVAVRRAAGH